MRVLRLFALLLIWLACLVAALVAWVWMLLAGLAGSPRFWTLAVGFDQLGNACTGGSEDETISSRANRGRKEGVRWCCLLCRLLDLVDRNHCERSAGT